MSSREHDLPAHVAFGQLVLRMAQGEPFTARKVASTWGRNMRTAQRWLSDIDLAVFPLEQGPQRLRWRKR